MNTMVSSKSDSLTRIIAGYKTDFENYLSLQKADRERCKNSGVIWSDDINEGLVRINEACDALAIEGLNFTELQDFIRSILAPEVVTLQAKRAHLQQQSVAKNQMQLKHLELGLQIVTLFRYKLNYLLVNKSYPQ